MSYCIEIVRKIETSNNIVTRNPRVMFLVIVIIVVAAERTRAEECDITSLNDMIVLN